MGKISRMSTHLANMIAAGEVVERPSSVVKELVENAIDANSKSIIIYLKNGGLEEIKVVDDGDGMDKDDVVLAFQPHATSKIKNEYDLTRILTLGFRGEAIASIASVSTMSITSSCDGIEGYSCTYKAGVKIEEGITHSNKGTTVLVKGLFFNTPARLKYMKAAKSELASIMFFIDRISMAHPDLKFTVYHDGKHIFNTTGSSDYTTLIGEVYGLEAAKNVITRSYAHDGYKTTLVFVKPSIYRANKLEISMICNGRYVKNYNITNAVVEAFQTYLPINKYPIGIMYFDIDPLLVDVNVHPSKTEIKISNEEEIALRLKEEIRLMLEAITLIPTRELPREEKKAYIKETIFELPTKNDSLFELNEEACDYVFENNDDKEVVENKVEEIIILNKEEKNGDDKIPYMEYVGTIFGTYLIFQNSEGMYMLDQHAAAERINYEKYFKILSQKNQPTTELLVPIMLSFTKNEALYVEQNLDKFSEIGFVLEPAGEVDFIVRQIPLWAKQDDIEGLVYDILSNIVVSRRIDIMYFRDKIAKQISCKASIKANHQISRMEIDYLISKLRECDNPYTCPHGRPSLIKLTLSDIEKMFERIQK